MSDESQDFFLLCQVGGFQPPTFATHWGYGFFAPKFCTHAVLCF